MIFKSGPIELRTEGAIGVDVRVMSSSKVQGHPSGRGRPGPFLYDSAESSCTAEAFGLESSVTITNGVVETSYVPDTQEAVRSQKVPGNPPPGYTIGGTLDRPRRAVGVLRIVLDDRRESMGGIIVNAAHMYLLGPIAKGDLIFGESRCAVGESAVAAFGPTSAAAARAGAAGAGEAARLANTGSHLLLLLGAPFGLLASGTVCVARRSTPRRIRRSGARAARRGVLRRHDGWVEQGS